MSTGDKRRRLLVDASVKHVIGGDASRQAGADALNAQSFKIATFVKQSFDAGFEPANMIRMLLSGACFIADNCGVSRDQLVQAIRMSQAPADAQLIYKPQGD